MTTLGQTGLDKKGMSLHSLRYIHATWFLSEGDTLDRMAHRLGHFSTDITYKHYRLFIEKTMMQPEQGWQRLKLNDS